MIVQPQHKIFSIEPLVRECLESYREKKEGKGTDRTSQKSLVVGAVGRDDKV